MGRLLIWNSLIHNFSFRELLTVFSYYLTRSVENKKGREFIRFVENSSKYNYRIQKKGDFTLVSITVNEKAVTLYLRRTYADLMVFRQIFLVKEYAPILATFKSHNFQPKNMIDGGGNIGLSSLFFSLYYPSINKIVVEPNTANFDLMGKNFRINNLKRVSQLKKGIWSKDTRLGALVLREEDLTGWGFKIGEKEDGDIEGTSLASVFDAYDLRVIDFLKLDIEGAEEEVFKNSEDSLAILKKVNAIAVEPHSRSFEEKIMLLLSREGFEVIKTGELVFGMRKAIIPSV